MDKTINIAKGIAIFSMVIGHVINHESSLSIFIYKWHMPLFFFFSGFFFNIQKYKFKNFLIRKIKSLYIPFILWSLLILGLHNFLVKIHIDSLPYYGLHEYKLLTYRIIFELKQYEPLLGTFWFLVQLLAVNIFSYLFFLCIKYIRKDIHFIAKSLILCLSVILSILFNKYNICIYYHINWITFLALVFFITGNILNSFHLTGKKQLIYSTLFLFIISQWSFKEMINLSYNEIILYYLSGICGIIIIYNFSMILTNTGFIGNIFSYMGQRSMSIMILHFSCFKLVSILIIHYHKLPVSYMSSHPIIENINIWWQISYILIGIIISLSLDKIYLISKNFIHRIRTNEFIGKQ